MSKIPQRAHKAGDDRWRRLSSEIERRDSSESRYLLYLGRLRLRGQVLRIGLAVMALLIIGLVVWAAVAFSNLRQSRAQAASIAQTATAFVLQASSFSVSTTRIDIALTPTVAAIQTQAAMVAATSAALAMPTATPLPTATPPPPATPTSVPVFKARVTGDPVNVFLNSTTNTYVQKNPAYLPTKGAEVVLCHKYSTRYQITVMGDCNKPSGWMEEKDLELIATLFPQELTIPEP